MPFAILSAVALGIVLLAGVVLVLMPERWYGKHWYTEPSSLFSVIALITIMTVLVVPHS